MRVRKPRSASTRERGMPTWPAPPTTAISYFNFIRQGRNHAIQFFYLKRKFQAAYRCRVKAHCHSFAILYIYGVNRLTKQEQRVLCIVLGLLLLGLAVKAY